MRNNWDDFRFFLAVARHGTLSRAGSYLGVDHATVGRRITALEDSLGVPLFHRSPQGYSLADQGYKLLPLAEQLESDAMRVFDEVAGASTSLTGTIRIATHVGIASFLLAESAAELCRLHPGLEVQLQAVPRSFSMSKREADLVLTGTRPQTGRVKIKKLATYPLHIYGERNYVARNQPIKQKKHLAKLRGIGYVPDMIFDKELDYIPSVDPSLKAHLTSTSLHVQLQMALAGAGVCILPDYIAKNYDTLVPVLDDSIELERELWLTVPEDFAHLTRIRTIVDFISEDVVSRIKSTNK